jgi:membrane protease subunit (stomatin/prohibitin family)
MEKIIFFGLAIPILAFVIYLGGGAIMKGFSAKVSNRPDKQNEENNEQSQEFNQSINHLSDEINKLNELLNNGVINQEEFEKAKKKILDKY